ncbi:MAG: hypothetical protein WC612_02150 [Bdellovibrionales bacterium]|jgi:hypothetical protein
MMRKEKKLDPRFALSPAARAVGRGRGDDDRGFNLDTKPVIPAQAGIPFVFLHNESFHALFGIRKP